MSDRRKLSLFVLFGIVVAALLLLSASLSDYRLQPGQPFRFAGETAPGAPVARDLTALEKTINTVRNVVGVLLLVLLPFAIYRFVTSRDFRRRVLRSLVAGLLVYLVVYVFLRNQLLGALNGLQPLAASDPAQPAEAARIVAFENQLPEWSGLVVSLALAVLIVLGVWLMWRRRRPATDTLQQVAREAQQAMAYLRAGDGVADVVTRCYVDMCRAVDKQRGLHRSAAMTPREFEMRLTAAGLPVAAVQRLTRLFESVRYGARSPGGREQGEAMACLAAIARAAGRAP